MELFQLMFLFFFCYFTDFQEEKNLEKIYQIKVIFMGIISICNTGQFVKIHFRFFHFMLLNSILLRLFIKYFTKETEMGNLRSEPDITKKTECSTENSVQYGVSCMRGWREYMEDSHAIKCDDNVSIFAIFDGHGGPQCAAYASEHFIPVLQKNSYYSSKNYQRALQQAFAEIDQAMLTPKGKAQLASIRKKNADKENAKNYTGDTVSGCTANVCLITSTHIYCANAGDSRSVAACRDEKTKRIKSKPLSNDHTPEDKTQKNRIYKAGGFVDKNGRINGNLNLSRALGDFNYKKNPKLKAHQQLIISTPDITKMQRKDLCFIIMGCDGIWEKKTNDRMVQWIQKKIVNENYGKNCKRILQKLLDEQIGQSIDCELGMDNMTAILIFL